MGERVMDLARKGRHGVKDTVHIHVGPTYDTTEQTIKICK